MIRAYFTAPLCAAAIGGLAMLLPVSASAACGPDPDPETDCRDTRSAAEREADVAEIRRLNNEQARYVRQRDARLTEQAQARNARQAERYARERQRYEQNQAQYEAEMAEWRRRVRLCREGHYEYCD